MKMPVAGYALNLMHHRKLIIIFAAILFEKCTTGVDAYIHVFIVCSDNAHLHSAAIIDSQFTTCLTMLLACIVCSNVRIKPCR